MDDELIKDFLANLNYEEGIFFKELIEKEKYELINHLLLDKIKYQVIIDKLNEPFITNTEKYLKLTSELYSPEPITKERKEELSKLIEEMFSKDMYLSFKAELFEAKKNRDYSKYAHYLTTGPKQINDEILSSLQAEEDEKNLIMDMKRSILMKLLKYKTEHNQITNDETSEKNENDTILQLSGVTEKIVFPVPFADIPVAGAGEIMKGQVVPVHPVCFPDTRYFLYLFAHFQNSFPVFG